MPERTTSPGLFFALAPLMTLLAGIFLTMGYGDLARSDRQFQAGVGLTGGAVVLVGAAVCWVQCVRVLRGRA